MLTHDELELACECGQDVPFSLADISENKTIVACPSCGKKYGFQEGPLTKKIKLFTDLCKTIRESEEILGDTNVAVDVGPHQAKVPFKLLLTRLRSTLDLKIGDRTLVISYRTEPSLVAKALETKKKGLR